MGKPSTSPYGYPNDRDIYQAKQHMFSSSWMYAQLLITILHVYLLSHVCYTSFAPYTSSYDKETYKPWPGRREGPNTNNDGTIYTQLLYLSVLGPPLENEAFGTDSSTRSPSRNCRGCSCPEVWCCPNSLPALPSRWCQRWRRQGSQWTKSTKTAEEA
jgi:hypothetical protein